VCVLQSAFCLPEEGLLRPGIRSPIYQILSRVSYLQTTLNPGGTTCNCKHPYYVLTGAHYQTSYLPNIPPHSNKGEEVTVKTNGGDFGIYGKRSNKLPRKDLVLLERKAAPSILPEGNVMFGAQCMAPMCGDP
jgi:hypothetical protein